MRHAELSGAAWDQAFYADLEVAAASKSNFRRGSHREGAAWAQLRDWEAGVGNLVRAALPAGWELGERGEALSSRPAVVGLVVATTLLDAANLSKSLADALEGVVYHTDASLRTVTTCTAGRRRGVADLSVAFARLDGRADAAALLAAGAALNRAWLDAHRPPADPGTQEDPRP